MLAQVDLDPGNPLGMPSQHPGSGFYQTLVVLGAIAVAIIIGVLWAIRYSKNSRSRNRHRSHRRKPVTARPGEVGSAGPPNENSKRKKWKEMRRPHRPMNPTLAQTRGLPPVRDPNTPPHPL